jgi:hypothetical protein
MPAISDCGRLFGYCYQPLRIREEDGCSTPYHPCTGIDGTSPERMPMCDTVEEAVAILERYGYRGEVQRYAKDGTDQPPWITAGIVADVTPTKKEELTHAD